MLGLEEYVCYMNRMRQIVCWWKIMPQTNSFCVKCYGVDLDHHKNTLHILLHPPTDRLLEKFSARLFLSAHQVEYLHQVFGSVPEICNTKFWVLESECWSCWCLNKSGTESETQKKTLTRPNPRLRPRKSLKWNRIRDWDQAHLVTFKICASHIVEQKIHNTSFESKYFWK